MVTVAPITKGIGRKIHLNTSNRYLQSCRHSVPPPKLHKVRRRPPGQPLPGRNMTLHSTHYKVLCPLRCLGDGGGLSTSLCSEALACVGAHPHIVSLRYACEQSIRRTRYLLAFMDFVNPSVTLQDYMSRGELYIIKSDKPTLDDVVPYLIKMSSDLIRALQHIHQCGVVHQDVKPANIMGEPSAQPRTTRAAA